MPTSARKPAPSSPEGEWYCIAFKGFVELTGFVTEVTVGFYQPKKFHVDLPEKIWGGNPMAPAGAAPPPACTRGGRSPKNRSVPRGSPSGARRTAIEERQRQYELEAGDPDDTEDEDDDEEGGMSEGARVHSSVCRAGGCRTSRASCAACLASVLPFGALEAVSDAAGPGQVPGRGRRARTGSVRGGSPGRGLGAAAVIGDEALLSLCRAAETGGEQARGGCPARLRSGRWRSGRRTTRLGSGSVLERAVADKVAEVAEVSGCRCWCGARQAPLPV